MRRPLPWRRARLVGNEDGAVLVMATVGLLVVLLVAAFAVDLSAVRNNRTGNQLAADIAASAGALGVFDTGGQEGCQAAVDYVEINTGVAFGGVDCLALPPSCDLTTADTSTTDTSGDFTITVTYPVSDSSPLMTSEVLGAVPQSLVARDLRRCDRIAITVVENHSTWFAGLIGIDDIDTTVHAVAVAFEPEGEDIVLNLLVLHRTDCKALTVSGSGGGNGGIIVEAVDNPITGGLDPGIMGVDSDGSGCSGSNGTLDLNGLNSFVRADGPAGCAADIGGGKGCGEIKLFAPGTPGCNFPACGATEPANVLPSPIRLPRRLTRAPVDYQYNCKAVYPVSYDISGCPKPPAPHIDNLVAFVGASGTPAGFSSYIGAGYPCNIGSGLDFLLPKDNWHVDCPDISGDGISDLQINGRLIFQGGSVVFDGDVKIASDGTLAVNAIPPADPADPFTPVDDEAFAYFRAGSFSKSGQASLHLLQTTVYMAPPTSLSLAGGASGELEWTAPLTGNLHDLALWSDSVTDHKLAGQAQLTLSGTFFVPLGEVTYNGNGFQTQVSAQLIGLKIHSKGQGFLILKPRFERSIKFPRSPASELIR